MSKPKIADFFGTRGHVSIRGTVNKVLVTDFLLVKQERLIP